MHPPPAHLQPLFTVLNHAEGERDSRADHCRRAHAARKSAEAQTEQLLAYRREYEQRWGTQFRTGGHMEVVHCYRGFMDRLTGAIEQQQRSAAQHTLRCEEASAALLAAETRVATVRRLIERRIEEARRAGERLEQKQTDEFAARAAWNARDEPNTTRIG